MSIYNFKISDYHAIKQANIVIDGITVLAGENGGGKSTLSRWLYYIMNVATEFERYQIENFKRSIDRSFGDIYRVSREIRVEDKDWSHNLSNIWNVSTDMHFLSDILNWLHAFIDKYIYALTQFLVSNTVSDYRKKRVLNILSIEEGETDKAIAIFSARYHDLIERLTRELFARLEKREIRGLYYLIHSQFEEYDDNPKYIQLYEDDVPILEKKTFGSILNIDRVIYIDTPDANDSDNVFWQKLKQMMVRPSETGLSEDNKDIRFLVLMLNKLLHGKIEVKNNLLRQPEFLYTREDGLLNIPLSKVATGMKLFAYLMRLLQNGYLDDKTILMIDEPEAHLHPQWIVEFARLLVFLQSKLGVKILIASHNPDMVAAIQAISRRQNILEHVHYYLTEADENEPYKYNFKELGSSIEQIFESFNIALSRIQQYGISNI